LWWSVVAGVVVVAVGGGVFWWLVVRPGESASAPLATATATSSGAAPAEAVRMLERLPSDPGAAIATGMRGLTPDPRAGVPAGWVLKAEPRTWSPDGMGGGTMAVTLTPPGGPATEYLVYLTDEGGSWKVVATLPVEGTAAPTATAAPTS
jgi:hypothetical protein